MGDYAGKVTNFVNAGGGLVMVGESWRWLDNHKNNTLKDHPTNKVLNPMVRAVPPSLLLRTAPNTLKDLAQLDCKVHAQLNLR